LRDDILGAAALRKDLCRITRGHERPRDGRAVALALGTTLQTCTGCHAAFRQSVVDEETWSRATSTPSPPS